MGAFNSSLIDRQTSASRDGADGLGRLYVLFPVNVIVISHFLDTFTLTDEQRFRQTHSGASVTPLL